MWEFLDDFFDKLIVAFVVMVLCFMGFVAGKMDSSILNLPDLNSQIAKCENNEGVRVIYTNYSVTCKNGAEFKLNK